VRDTPSAPMSRRKFLTAAAAAGGIGYLGACAVHAPTTEKRHTSTQPAPTRTTYSTSIPIPFPRLGGMLISSPQNYDDPAFQQQIARLDLAILNMYNHWTGAGSSPSAAVNAIKALNPNILLGNYTIMTEVPSLDSDVSTANLRAKVSAEKGPGGVGDWWAYTADGQHTSHFGRDTWDTNLTLLTTPDSNGDRWPQWLAKRDNALISNADFDIWYSDNCLWQPRVNVDWNRDGINDDFTSEAARNWWRDGQRAYYDSAKSLQASKFLMLNTDNDLDGSVRPGRQSFTQYAGVAHGAYLEKLIGEHWSAETPSDGWADMMAWYHHVFANLLFPHIVMFNVGLDPTDCQTFRYGFGSCLLNDGFFSVSDSSYHDVLWFDEFDLAGTSSPKWLGLPIDPPQTIPWSNGVYRREFTNGLVLVNPKGNGSQTIDVTAELPILAAVGSGFRRFKGSQDSATNNGAPVTSSVTLADRDGLILVRESSHPGQR
jgi:hypothetical protein